MGNVSHLYCSCSIVICLIRDKQRLHPLLAAWDRPTPLGPNISIWSVLILPLLQIRSVFGQGYGAWSGSRRKSIEEGWKQKPRQTVVIAFWGEMAAHWHCVADELIKAGLASNTVTCVLIKKAVLLSVCTCFGSSVVALKMFTLKGTGSNPIENLKKCNWYFYRFVYFQTEGSWFESSKCQYKCEGVPCFCIYH